LTHSIWSWVGFNLLVLVMLAVDLGLFNRKAHQISIREAGIWSAVVITVALIFNFGVYRTLGPQSGLEFLTGYLIEFALSVDNLFVFALIFAYFKVPPQYQHRVLFWGIIGALVLRGVMIGVGALLIERFDWIMYVFGGFLVITGIRMAKHDEINVDPAHNPVLKLVRRFVPVSKVYHGQAFFTRELNPKSGALRRVATPLFLVLVLVETTDVVFAVDSIPAIFGVTRDPFIVYTSNVFAVLGLRSLYFVLAGVIDKFHYLKLGLSIVLVWIGAKMLLLDVFHMPIAVSLGVVATVLAASIGASLLFPKRAGEHSQHVSETAEKTRASRKPEEDEVIPPIS
jgi:tellurite resistance protein TerC